MPGVTFGEAGRGAHSNRQNGDHDRDPLPHARRHARISSPSHHSSGSEVVGRSPGRALSDDGCCPGPDTLLAWKGPICTRQRHGLESPGAVVEDARVTRVAHCEDRRYSRGDRGAGDEAAAEMWKPTIRGLLARKVRLVLTALAVLLGVAFIERDLRAHRHGQAVVRRGVRADARRASTCQVQGASPLGRGDPQRIPEAALDEVRGGTRASRRAEGYVQGYAQFVDDDGKSIGGGGPPTFGVSWIDDGPFRLVDDGKSRAPRRAGEVAMDLGTAAGARVRGRRPGARAARRPGAGVPHRRALRVRRPDRLRCGHLRRLRPRDRAGSVRRARRARPRSTCSASPACAIARAAAAARARRSVRGTRCSPPTRRSRRCGEPVRQFLGFFTVRAARVRGHRRGGRRVHHLQHLHDPRDPAHPRARAAAGDGRDRRAGGLVGGARGVRRGRGGVGDRARRRDPARDRAARAPARARPRSCPRRRPCVLDAHGRRVAGGRGARRRSSASLLPAMRAARVPPVAAINGVQVRAHGGLRRRVVTGLLVVARRRRRARARPRAVGVGVSGVFEQVQVVALGAFALLVGVVVLLAAVARPLAGAIGRPLRGLGVSGVLARENAMRNPRRTAVTASALVIGLALVGLTATFGASAKASVRQRHRRRAAGRLRGEDRRLRRLLDRGRRPAARACPSSTRWCRCGSPTRAVDGDGRDRSAALDPDRLADVVDLDFVSGGVDGLALDGGGVLLEEKLAERVGASIGDVDRAAVRAGHAAADGARRLPQRELHRHLRPVDPDPRRAGDARRRGRRRPAGHAGAGDRASPASTTRRAREMRGGAGRRLPQHRRAHA